MEPSQKNLGYNIATNQPRIYSDSDAEYIIINLRNQHTPVTTAYTLPNPYVQMALLRVHFVRHGETQSNSQRIIQGHLDIELNELGHKQAGVVAERLRHVPFDMAFSSDLSRATKTAEPILSYHQGVTLELHKDLRGQFMGSLQGKGYTPGIVVPVDETVETPEAFMERVKRWWSEYLLKHLASLPPKLDETPHEILIVSHEVVIAILVQKLTGQNMLTHAQGMLVSSSPNTAVSVIEVETDGKAVVKEYGDASHLAVAEE